MSIKLKELIRAVRACKTAAAERSVVSQELALIRTAFKEEQLEYRNRNVAKLLFMHMLGYPSHFGQMECIKLITSPEFTDKRIGYLGLMLLLTEKEEVLMLVTNSLKVDLNSQNPFVVGLALTTVGNLATPDIARDLMMDVDRYLQSNNPYLRKKAALCTIRILQKNPDHVEDFAERIVGVLKDRHHGVLLAGVQLMTSIVALDPKAYAGLFARVVPSLVRLLKNLVSTGYSPDHDVAGVTNPFLQVKTLKLLRVLGEHGGSDDAAEAMNDILAQVASTTETAKNAGNAILYECVNTIIGVQSEQGLQVLAINILGRFLLNRDNNIRYVALNTLGRVVERDMAAVQRHRTTIVDCLKDPDVSIRQRALELIYQLVNEGNVAALTSELLNYLVVALPEHKAGLCDKIMDAVQQFATDRRWRIDTLISMLGIAGDSASDAIACNTIIYIGQCPEYQGHVVHKLHAALAADLSTQANAQPALARVAVWCIGEYGELLARAWPALDVAAAASNNSMGVSSAARAAVPLSAAVELLAALMTHHSATAGLRSAAVELLAALMTHHSATAGLRSAAVELLAALMTHHSAIAGLRSYCITALAKLSGRGLLSPEDAARAGVLVGSYGSSLQVDLQQRACEFTQLLGGAWSSVRGAALDKVPAIDEAALRERRARKLLGSGAAAVNDADLFDGGDASPGPQQRRAARQQTASPTPAASPPPPTNLLDLDDIFGGGSATAVGASAPGAAFGSSGGGSVDLLADIFSSLPPPQPHAAQPALPPADMFGGGMGGSTAAAAPFAAAAPAAAPPSFVAFEKGSLRVVFALAKPDAANPSTTQITARFSNAGGSPLEAFVFQAAVPKYLTMRLMPPSAGRVAAGAPDVEQVVVVTNEAHGSKDIMMRIKIAYTVDGQQVQEMAQISDFPKGF